MQPRNYFGGIILKESSQKCHLGDCGKEGTTKTTTTQNVTLKDFSPSWQSDSPASLYTSANTQLDSAPWFSELWLCARSDLCSSWSSFRTQRRNAGHGDGKTGWKRNGQQFFSERIVPSRAAIKDSSDPARVGRHRIVNSHAWTSTTGKLTIWLGRLLTKLTSCLCRRLLTILQTLLVTTWGLPRSPRDNTSLGEIVETSKLCPARWHHGLAWTNVAGSSELAQTRAPPSSPSQPPSSPPLEQIEDSWRRTPKIELDPEDFFRCSSQSDLSSRDTLAFRW